MLPFCKLGTNVCSKMHAPLLPEEGARDAARNMGEIGD